MEERRGKRAERREKREEGREKKEDRRGKTEDRRVKGYEKLKNTANGGAGWCRKGSVPKWEERRGKRAERSEKTEERREKKEHRSRHVSIIHQHSGIAHAVKCNERDEAEMEQMKEWSERVSGDSPA